MRFRHRWPRNIVIEELFVNDNSLRNHVHVASRQRRKLIKLAKVAKHRYADGDPAPVREFPPFDPVDDVHTDCTWHQRDSSNPDHCRDYEHRGDGLAFDLRSASREKFAHEVKRRYHVKETDL